MCACVCKYTKDIYVHVLFSLHGCIHSMLKKTLGSLGKGSEKLRECCAFLCFSCSSQHLYLAWLVCALTLHLLLFQNYHLRAPVWTCRLSEKSICSWSIPFSCLQEKCEILQKESQSFKWACAKWLILCTLMPCFSRVRFLIENAQPFLPVCCLASAVKEPRTDIIFSSFETLLCLIWVTIFFVMQY